MAEKSVPSLGLLRQLLTLDEATGLLYWRRRPLEMFTTSKAHRTWNTRYARQEAFACTNASGYKVSSIFDRKFYGHRVVFAMVHGRWPTVEIDHIDGDRGNNHPDNLREATRQVNARNCALGKDNTSGAKGVFWSCGKWRATILKKSIGRFDTFDEAVVARKAAERLHGFHPNHGRAV